MKARYLPIEIIRTIVPTGAKGKKVNIYLFNFSFDLKHINI